VATTLRSGLLPPDLLPEKRAADRNLSLHLDRFVVQKTWPQRQRLTASIAHTSMGSGTEAPAQRSGAKAAPHPASIF
jgi:hypothetical protein